jgi:hypothetical protein
MFMRDGAAQTQGVTSDDVAFGDFFARNLARVVRACLLLI